MSQGDSTTQLTLGQAIDLLVQTLDKLDSASQQTALAAACGFLKIPFGSPTTAIDKLSYAPPVTVAPQPTQDIRSLRDLKQPATANEMAALVAFYLAELAPPDSRTSEVDTQSMVKYFKQAGFTLPKIPRQLLHNAVRAGYFELLGEGRFRLNPVGYNLVAFQLPRTEDGSSDSGRRKRTKVRKSKKKSKRPKR